MRNLMCIFLLWLAPLAAMDLGSPFAKGWVPEDSRVLRGFILLDGEQIDGRWKEAAAHWDYAIIRTAGFGYGTKEDMWNAIQAAVRELGRRTGHPEIMNVPFYSTGYSRFSGTPRTMTSFAPERSLGFSNGFGPSSPVVSGKHERSIGSFRSTPSLWMGASGENVYNRGMSKMENEWRRAPGTLRGVAMTWNTYHNPHNHVDIAIPWINRLIEMRVPKDWDPLKGPVELKTLKEEDGWVGLNDNWWVPLDELDDLDGENNEIFAFSDFDGDFTRTSWLPDESTAWMWRAYNSRHPKVKLVSPSHENVALHEEQSIKATLHLERDLRVGETVRFTARVIEKCDLEKVEFFDGTTKLGESSTRVGGDAPFGDSFGSELSIETQFKEAGIHALMVSYTLSSGQVGWSRLAPVRVMEARP